MNRLLARLLLILFLLTSLVVTVPLAAAPPSEFTAETVPGLDRLDQPTAFAFLPGGEMLIATKPGRLLLYRDGTLRDTPVIDRSSVTCANSERGLLGVAVDPQFITNRYIYIYYTFNKFNIPSCPTNSSQDPVNRVSRLTLDANLIATNESVLVDNIPSPNGNHNAGDLQFGNDGYLYVSVGDGGRNDTARQLHNLSGTILRITRDGGIPADNPFLGEGSVRCNQGSANPGARCQEIFAFGLRNPFRISFDPNEAGTRFYINDVGQSSVEEISAGRASGDYGWNCFEGTRVNSTAGDCAGLTLENTVQPTFQYRRDGEQPPSQPAYFDNCTSITGGAFVPASVWPVRYDGAYLFGDYACRGMFTLFPAGETELFDGNAGRPTHIAFGPYQDTQALYYADFFAGRIVRVRFTGSANRSPIAHVTASPTSGSAPLQVAFDASASSDPDSDDRIAAYLWDFGDGSAPLETTSPTISHEFNTSRVYQVKVRVRDSRGTLSTNLATVQIDVGNRLYLPLARR